ncbi:MAG: IS982 family transposase [Thioploca sp.]|nr:IS982 family transposase [Thioploca sp.]
MLKTVRTIVRNAFPNLVSYNRFVELMQSVLIPLCAYLYSRKGKSQGIAFIDSMPIRVGHNRRINRHRTFEEVARRGKNSVDGFYGFKLHLVINDGGDLIAFFITRGNTDDRQVLEQLTQGLTGKLFGDKGYISKALRENLLERGLELITKLKRNMKPISITDFDNALLRKRSIIETVNDQLKNISQIEHTRHRSLANFMVNLIAALIAYTWQPKKPSLNLHHHDFCLVSV